MVLQNVRIGIRIGSADPYWVQMREAVIRQAQQLELELIPVDFNATARSVEGQVAVFEDLAAQDLDALICFLSSTTARLPRTREWATHYSSY